MGQAQTEPGTASANPNKIHMERSGQRRDPRFLGCSSSPAHETSSDPPGAFPDGKPPQIRGTNSAPFQPKTHSQPGPGWGFSQ